MINKKGFTLAEVLITLGVIGLVAALTLPSMYNNYQKALIGKTLARSVELVEQGMLNIRQEAQLNSETGDTFETLSSIKKSDLGLSGSSYITDSNAFYNSTKSFLGIENSDYDVTNISAFAGNLDTNLKSLYTAYKFNKLNAIVAFQIKTGTTTSNDSIISRVIIDANGAAKPNTFGKDVFIFGLTNSGTLIPAGTQKYADFDSKIPADGCSGSSVGNGTACAARVMADKWEIKYY